MEEKIKLAQRILQMDGNYAGAIDGIPGPMTLAGIERSQRIPKSWPLNRKIVGFLQLSAEAKGIDSGPLDGFWGPQTASAYEALEHLVHFGKPKPAWRPDELIHSHPKKWPVQHTSEFRNFFGERGEHNLQTIEVPYKMYISWEPYSLVTRIRCHKKVANSLSTVLTNVKRIYGDEEIKRLRLNVFGGCYNNRLTRQGTSWSMHAWGIALDFDPVRNPLHAGRDVATFARPEYEAWWKCWEDEGWVSMGRVFNYDWMHVQAARFF